MDALRLIVVSDAICPWCWIGKRRLDQALALLKESDPELSFAPEWHPYLLNPEMPAEGKPRDAYRAEKFGSVERGRELDARVAAAGAESGLAFRFDRIARTPNTVPAHALARLAAEAGRQAEAVEALFVAYFHDGHDISAPEVLGDIAAANGLDREATVARIAFGEGADEIAAEAAAWSRAGISGVPSFILHRHLVAAGAYPAEELARRLRAMARDPEVMAA